MEPEPGDELVVDADRSGHAARVGRILAVQDSNGHRAYLVHWVAGDYDSVVSPWPGVHFQHRDHNAPGSVEAVDDPKRRPASQP